MTHDEIKKNLSAYHDGELPFLEMLAVKTHLAICPECYLELSQLRDLDALFAPSSAVTERAFETAVMARIMNDAPEADARAVYAGWWKVPALALASCAVYAVCVETGLLPSGYDLASALAAQSEAQKLSSVLFGNSRGGNEQMLAMLLDGDKK